MTIRNLCCILGMAALLAACSEPPRPPEQVVAERAQERWDALVAESYQTAREYYTPGFRERVPLDTYIRSEIESPFNRTDTEISSVACEDQRCEVTATLFFEIPSAPNQLSGFRSRQTIKEIWLFIDDQWWYSPG